MRLSLKIAIALVVGLAALDLVLAQQPGGFGGALQGILGGKQQQNIESLLTNASVKKELKLTDEQLAKVPGAVLEALAKVLDADQYKRFKQIELQNRDHTAFGDPSLQELLQLTAQQKGDIKTILVDADKETQKVMGDVQGAIGGAGKGKGGAGKGIGGGGMQEKIQAISKEAKEQCLATLTAEQKRTWNEMLGDAFTVEQPLGIGGFDLKGLDLKNLDLNNIQDLLKNLKKKGG